MSRRTVNAPHPDPPIPEPPLPVTSPPPEGPPSLLATTAVAKSFGTVVALRSVDLAVAAGQVHALLGANGAGKSTLVKILTGVLRADAGTVAIAGRPVDLRRPSDAHRFGLAPVFQDPALVPDLTVAQNLRLTGADVDAVRAQLAAMDLDGLDLGEQVRDVPLPFLRMLDLARALSSDPQLLLLDEITAALPPDLSERVFEVMRQWKARDRSVLFISHRLAEVREHCDMCTVLRDGRSVASFVPREGGEAQIVATMLGDAAVGGARGGAWSGCVRPASTGVRSSRPVASAPGASSTRSASPSRRARCSGSPRSRARARSTSSTSSPATDGPSAASCVIDGRVIKPRHPFDVIRKGVVLVPADRLHALLPQRSIRENIAAPLFNRVARWGPISGRAERARVQQAVGRLSIDTRAAAQVRRLSGGNQQKVTIARWLAPGLRGDAAVRPDPGHRRRHEAPGVRPDRPARRRGRRRGDVHERAARDRPGVRPRRRAARRADRGRAARHRQRVGAADRGPRPRRRDGGQRMSERVFERANHQTQSSAHWCTATVGNVSTEVMVHQ